MVAHPWALLHWTVAMLLLAGVGTLSGVSAYRQPRTRAIVHLPLAQASEHRLPPSAVALAWWRQELNLGPRREGVGPWTLGSGDETLGYRLHLHGESGEAGAGETATRTPRWSWRLERVASDQGPRLLAAGNLASMPRRLMLLRRDEWLEVRAESLFLARCVDLLPVPATRVWWARTPTGGQETMDVVDEQALRPSLTLTDDIKERNLAERRELEALRRLPSLVSQAIARVLDGSDSVADLHKWQLKVGAQRFDRAEEAELNDQMGLWLAWAACQAHARASSVDTARLVAALEILAAIAGPTGNAPQIPGLLMATAHSLLLRLDESGLISVAAEPELARRSEVLTALDSVLDILLDNQRPWNASLGDSERVELQLCQHAVRLLAGRAGNPTPAAAPAWAAARWRAAAGTLPIPDPLPALPAARPGEDWVRPTLAGVLDHLGIGPSSPQNTGAMILRAQILTILADGGEQSSSGAIMLLDSATAPPREVALTRAILTARGLVNPYDGILPLLQADGDDTPLAERDPLAWALYRLILHRRRGVLLPHLVGSRLPPGLSPYARLLSGRPDATRIAFSAGPSALAPAEALAAALAMQEVAGLAPDWSKRRGLPSLTLPLALLEPVSARSGP